MCTARPSCPGHRRIGSRLAVMPLGPNTAQAPLFSQASRQWLSWLSSVAVCVSLRAHCAPENVRAGRRLCSLCVARPGAETWSSRPRNHAASEVRWLGAPNRKQAPATSVRKQLPSATIRLSSAMRRLLFGTIPAIPGPGPRPAGPLLFRPPMLLPTSFQARSSFPRELTTSKPLLSPKKWKKFSIK
jgi:hypothetical protein